MKLTPPAAISRIAARFHERRARAAGGERPPLTKGDEENLTAFAQIVQALSDLLDRENTALQGGDVMRVADLFEEKQDLLRRLETRQPVIEPFLRESAEITAQLRLQIAGLARRIETNAVLLSSMAEASRTIRQEVVRLRDRHSLKGMYGKSGQSLDGGGPRRGNDLDTNI